MRDKAQFTPGFLNLAHAAQWADVSQKTLKRWLTHGLPHFQEGPGTKILIRPNDIEQFLTRQQRSKSSLDQMVEETLKGLDRNSTKKGKSYP